MTPEEEQEILDIPPKGTWALLCAMAIAFMVGWLAFYYMFLSHGPVS